MTIRLTNEIKLKCATKLSWLFQIIYCPADSVNNDYGFLFLKYTIDFTIPSELFINRIRKSLTEEFRILFPEDDIRA